MTARTCQCGGKGEVRHTRGDLRRIHCPLCGTRWTTRETVQVAPPPRPRKVKKSKPKRTMGERMATRRGCLVPVELESDWGVLKLKGYTNFEAAKALKLAFKLPRKKVKK